MDPVQVVTMGVILIDFFPNETGKSLDQVSAFIPKPGGAPANVAVALARQGIRSAFIGTVGKDPFGKMLVDLLNRENVETSGVTEDTSIRTTIAFIAQPDPFHSEFLFYRPQGIPDQKFLSQDKLDLIQHCKIFHIDSPGLSMQPARSNTMDAVRIARDAGALISFDVNYRPKLWDSPEEANDQIKLMLPSVDLLKLNEVELKLITGSDQPESAKDLLALGPRLILVTLGEKGSWYFHRSGSGFIAAYRVETVDATGCGDAYLAAIHAKLLDLDELDLDSLIDKQLIEMVKYASAVGAITAQRMGAIPSLPRPNEIAEFLKSHLNEH